MAMMVVDGYNIIGAWQEFSDLINNELEDAREALADVLRNYAASNDMHIILVFDGYKVKGSLGSELLGNYVDVIYTAEGITADMMIERYVATYVKKEDIYVASSDRLVQEIILAQGALRISAQELHRLVKANRKEIDRYVKNSGQIFMPLDDRLDKETRQKMLALIFEKN